MKIERIKELLRLRSVANNAIVAKEEREKQEQEEKHPYETDDKLINLLA